MWRIFRGSAVALVSAAVIAGCGMAEARMCQQAGDAELCLVEQGQAFRVTGSGFEADSELLPTFVGGPEPTGRPAPWRAGDDGEVPAPGGLFFVSRGPDLQHLNVAATAAGGEAISFEFTVPRAHS